MKLDKDTTYWSPITEKVISYLEKKGYSVTSTRDYIGNTNYILVVHWESYSKHIMHGSSGVDWHRDVITRKGREFKKLIIGIRSKRKSFKEWCSETK